MFWFKAFFGYILYFVFINPHFFVGNKCYFKIFWNFVWNAFDSRCTSIGTTSKIKQIFLTLALYVNQNESKNLCTFQRTFEIENISTNENISVNENIVIMLLKKKYIVENYMHLTLCANLDSYFIVYKLCH